MLRRKRHRWIKDALIAIGVALLTIGAAELMAGFYKLVLALVAAAS